MLYFIGSNDYGEFGGGHTKEIKQLSAPNWSQNLRISQIYNGYEFSIYQDSNNIFYSAGYNEYGSCIQEKKEDKIMKACNIKSLQGIAIKSIYCNPVSWHGFILTKENKLYGFGQNEYGQLGDGTSSNKYTLTEIQFNHGIIKDIKCSTHYSLLLTMSGEVYATDYSEYGGNGQKAKNKNGAKRWNCIEWTDGWFTNKKHKLTNIAKIASGYGHSLCLDSNGNVLSFGLNVTGYLGLGTKDKNPHIKPTVIPFEFTISVIDICCGSSHSLLLCSNGNIFTFGSNRNGKCGHGYSGEAITRHKKVDSLKDIKMKQILCGSSHSAAITANNEIYLFGYNDVNQCIISTYDASTDKPIIINKYIEETYKKQVIGITLGRNNTKILLSDNKNIKANIEEKEIDKNEVFDVERKEEMKSAATQKWKVRNNVNIWLKQVVKLGEYCELFEENGFDNMLIIASMTEKHLKEIGIKKSGHRMKIMFFINEMRNKSNININIKEREKNEVKEWLTTTVGLGQYFNNFIEDGYEDMITITNSINEEDLIDMAIHKKGHRKRILIFIRKYKNKNEQIHQYSQIEGGIHAIVAPNIQDTAK